MSDKPISDPIADAENKYHCPFLEQRRIDHWKRWMAHCTTGQFANLDQGYIRHCGPTAITNVILTWNRRYHILRSPKTEHAAPVSGTVYYYPAPQVIFRQVSRIGTKRHFYYNTDVFRRFGGTYDLLLKKYLTACFTHYGCRFDMKGKYPLEDDDFRRPLQEDRLLYLQLYRHPVYGDHHLICHGMVEIASADSKIHKNYLIVADGWSRKERYIDTDDLVMCHFMELQVYNKLI